MDARNITFFLSSFYSPFEVMVINPKWSPRACLQPRLVAWVQVQKKQRGRVRTEPRLQFFPEDYALGRTKLLNVAR